MEDFERYGDYNEYEEDIPKSKNPVLILLKVLVGVICVGVVGLILFRLLVFNHYPDSMKNIYFNETLTEYYEQTNGDIGATTQELRAPYDDPDVANFFCDKLIVISGADQLQVCARFNLALVKTIKEKYGVEIDPKDENAFSFRLVRNPESDSSAPFEIGTLSVKYCETGLMYGYYKLVFDGVDFGIDDGEESVKWIRLEIAINGVEMTEPFSMICIYENNVNYSSFSDYKLSTEELPK